MTTSDAAVAIAPARFVASRRRAPRPRSRAQCATIPACDSVNAENAPTAKSGMRRSVIPRKTASRSAASTASTTMPLE